MTPGTAVRATAVLAAALLAGVVLPRFVPADAAALVPDLVLVLVVAAALLGGPARGALAGLLAGWLVDVLPPASQYLGTHALTYALAGAVAGLWRQERSRSVLVPALALLTGTVVTEGVATGLAYLGSHPLDLTGVALAGAVTVAVGSALLPWALRADRALVRSGLA